MTTCFRPFTSLPPEIRQRIWDLSCTPRTIILRKNAAITSPTRPPALLHACHESRTHLNHIDKYTTISISDSSPNHRYIWVNISLDTVDIGTIPLDHPQLRTLLRSITKITLHWGSSGTFMCTHDVLPNSQEQLLQGLGNLNQVEIHIKNTDSIPDRICNTVRWKWPCTRDKLRFVLEDMDETYDFDELVENMQGAHPIGLRSYLRMWHDSDEESW